MPVLRLAVAQGVHHLFAAHVLDLLGAPAVRATSQAAPLRVPETGETLTSREVEVLRLIAAGASNLAIAEALMITVHTVKTHVTHILRKLDVSSRTQAVARASESAGVGARSAAKPAVWSTGRGGFHAPNNFHPRAWEPAPLRNREFAPL